MPRSNIGWTALLALGVVCAGVAARGDEPAANKGEQPPPRKKEVDPVAILREKGIVISEVGEDGKKIALPPGQKVAMAVGALLGEVKTYSFTVSARGSEGEVRVDVRDRPGKEGSHLEKVGQDHWQADSWYGRRIVPLMVRNVFTAGTDGDVRMVVTLDDGTIELSSRSAPDAIYAVKALGLEKPFAGWMDKIIPKNSGDVVILDSDRFRVPELPGDKAGAKAAPADKEEWKSVIEEAQARYNEKRGELIKRMSGSLLYYGPNHDARSWSVRRAGDALFVRTSCVDRMFVAIFEVEFRREGEKWKYVKLHATEWFKGE